MMKLTLLSCGKEMLSFNKKTSFVFSYKVSDFCRTFAEKGNICNLILNSVKILSLTATATKDTFDCVLHHISLKDPVLIRLPPK